MPVKKNYENVNGVGWGNLRIVIGVIAIEKS